MSEENFGRDEEATGKGPLRGEREVAPKDSLMTTTTNPWGDKEEHHALTIDFRNMLGNLYIKEENGLLIFLTNRPEDVGHLEAKLTQGRWCLKLHEDCECLQK